MSNKLYPLAGNEAMGAVPEKPSSAVLRLGNGLAGLQFGELFDRQRPFGPCDGASGRDEGRETVIADLPAVRTEGADLQAATL
jgi:hypothetical protein